MREKISQNMVISGITGFEFSLLIIMLEYITANSTSNNYKFYIIFLEERWCLWSESKSEVKFMKVEMRCMIIIEHVNCIVLIVG